MSCLQRRRTTRRILLLSVVGVILFVCIFSLMHVLVRRSEDSAFINKVTTQLTSYDQPFDVTKRTDNPPFTTKDAFVDWMVRHTQQNAKFLKRRWDLSEVLKRDGDLTDEVSGKLSFAARESTFVVTFDAHTMTRLCPSDTGRPFPHLTS